MKTIKLAVVDDHELFRNGLKELLLKYQDIDVMASIGDGNSFLEFISQNQDLDIVLLDITMPGLDGFGVLDKIKDLNTSVKPIIISMHDEGHYIAKCAKKGAYGYLLKNTDQEELIKVVRIVSEGKKYFSPTIAEKMINYMSENPISEKLLSKKEQEVLELISQGFTTKEISEKLFVSTRTIETHRGNILRKLDVKNTAALIKKATKIKLI